MFRQLAGAALGAALLCAPGEADAFCGFYVAKADAELYNQASQVVLARKGDKTVVTMANDYQGAPSEFAMVIPVPVVIQQGDVKVVDASLMHAVDAFSAPRLVEYTDPNPCSPPPPEHELMSASGGAPRAGATRKRMEASQDALGVVIEARYTVEEYAVTILSAAQSGGLATWLRQEGYTIPAGAEQTLSSYIKQDMKFFLAKVDLEAHERGALQHLRPLQVHYRSPKFMLPIRLGTVNATGPQDLLVYTVTPKGRVETTNYRTVEMPTDLELPEFVATDFGDVHKAMFARQVEAHDRRGVFLEYAWPLSIMCDPCSADPLTVNQLQALGADWVEPGYGKLFDAAFLTRLHMRYDSHTFPDDLRFQETRDASTYQGRYVIHHPWTGQDECDAATDYRTELARRQAKEVDNLASLTGWSRWSIERRTSPRSYSGGGLIPEVGRIQPHHRMSPWDASWM